TSVARDSEPLEMIQVAPDSAPPLGVRLASDDGRVVEDDTRVVYAVDRREISVQGDATETLVLRGALPSGTEIEKTLRFTGNAYPISVTVRTKGINQQLSRIGVGWRHQIAEAVSGDPETRYRGVAIATDKKVVRELATTIATSPAKTFDPPVGWVG